MTGRRRWHWLIGLSLITLPGVCALGLGAGALAVSSSTYTITYRVTGTVPQAEVRYFAGTGPLSGRRGANNLVTEPASLPWEKTVVGDEFLNRRFASLQVRGGAGGATATLTCQVWINGMLAETRTGADFTWCGYDPERNPVP
jgi:hypothetical protein